jgi:hypothetical protein
MRRPAKIKVLIVTFVAVSSIVVSSIVLRLESKEIFFLPYFLERVVDSSSIGQTKSCATTCLEEVGQNGTWVQDWHFAEEYGQYPEPRVLGVGPYGAKTWGKFKPSELAPFRWESSWKWIDYSPNGCQVDATMSADDLCDVLSKLDVHRVLFIGDSLTNQQYASLLNRLGSDRIKNVTKLEYGLRASLACPLQSIDLLLQLEGGGQIFSHSDRNEYILHNTTRHFINSDPNRLLAVMNIGAHYHKMEHYKEDLDLLIQWLQEFDRPDDLYFFRTTMPGHKRCKPRQPRNFDWTQGVRESPLKTYHDYQLTKTHDWNLFEDYNAYTRARLRSSTIRILDVFNMTILRHDGHSGGGDCLHYFTPGPVDFWNHLLYTHLKELAKRTRAEEFAPGAVVGSCQEAT